MKQMRQGLRKIAKFGPKPEPDNSPVDEELMASAIAPAPERKPGPKSLPKEQAVQPLLAATFRAPYDSYVSPQDGTTARCETGAQVLKDAHGNEAHMSGMARSRPWQRMRRWLHNNFGA
jgi:hypothetical protein